MSQRYKRYAYLLRSPGRFSQAGNLILRPYQELAIQAVVNSVRKRRGMSFVWIFPRQSGKDEALAILVQYLLALFKNEGGEMVFFNPTFKPQTETSMRRLESHLRSNALTIGRWQRRSGYIYQFNNSYCTYLSADPSAHVVSATANRLLVVNEAQDVGILKYDKEIGPMAASDNATRLFSGTRWTDDTLLEREYQFAAEAEQQDRLRRVFFFTAEDVREIVPAYGAFVDEVVARLGRQHPLVKSQFFCETIEAQAGMFPPGRQALMRGSHSALTEPEPGKTYACLVDVAGQDEVRGNMEGGHAGQPLQNPVRDSTNLKIVQVDMSTVPLTGKPTYLVVYRQEWTGESHVKVFGAMRGLVETWKPIKIVIDATGVGEGLWSLLNHTFGADTVMPVKFTAKLKSELGYGFIGIIESGRYREYHPFPDKLRIQMNKCRSEILAGPAKLMRWGVPDGRRDETSGDQVHDDDLMTGAMCSLLDRLEWNVRTQPMIVPGRDPLEGMDHNF